MQRLYRITAYINHYGCILTIIYFPHIKSDMAIRIIIDTNIFIGFDRIDLIDQLIKYLNNDDIECIITEAMLEECKDRRLRNHIITHLTKRTIDRAYVKSIKKEFIGSYKHIHTGKKDVDYEIVALAIKERCDYLVTNDRDILKGFTRYKKEITKGITPMQVGPFLRLMHKSNKTLFGENINMIKKILKYYRKVEMENSYYAILDNRWDLKMFQETFIPYSSSIIETIKEE